MSRRLILIRHSKVEPAMPGAFVGSLDLPLSSSGVEEARRMKIDLGDLDFHLVCSPLKRALQTASLLFPERVPQIDARLAEIDFGDWENRTFEQIGQSHPDEVEKWANSPQEFTFPGGESVSAFIDRVEEWAAAFNAMERETVVAVTHGGVIRFLLCHLLKLPYERHLTFRCDRPSVNVVDLHEGFATLSGLNLDGFSVKRL